METCYILCADLWSGLWGSSIGALIGGIVAYLIARFQIKKLENQQLLKEKQEKTEKEIQLLWQIYFDIKKDVENSKLWEKYEQLIKIDRNNTTHPLVIYTGETMEYIMRDIKNLFMFLTGKENDCGYSTELNLLWERAGHLFEFMFKIYKEMGVITVRTQKYYEKAEELYKAHATLIEIHEI